RILKPSAGHPCSEESGQAALNEKFPPHLDYLERQLGQQDYVVGDRLTMAVIAMASQVLNLEHGGERLDSARVPALAAHYERMKARESFASILPGEQRMNAKLVEMGKAASH